MRERFEHLLQPGRIGAMALRNRIVMTPMGTNLERADGFLGERMLRYYEARARGGVGLVIAGVASVAWPRGACNPCQAALSDDKFMPAWRAFAKRVQRHGAKAAVQLQHAGRVAQEDVASGRALWVPSAPRAKGANDLFASLTPEERALATRAYTAPRAKLAYHEMSEEDIAWLVESFADAAARAHKSGLDGVELHAGHGYLLAAFLSPASNFRSDAYGGTPENRARLLCEILRAVRARCGPDFAVWCRVDGCEFRTEGGITVADARRTAALAVRAGADAVHVSAYADSTSGVGFTDAPLPHAPGAYLALAREIRAGLSAPVIAVGRIEPAVGDAAIRDGAADFIAAGRKLLADAQWPAALARGEPERARPCIYSYQCVGNVFLREASRCTVNPALARAREAAVPRVRARKKTFVVAGGGPAGLEFARRAARAGHRVTLFERAAKTGGRLRAAAQLDSEVARFVEWLTREAEHAGVEIRANTEATATLLARENADAFVLALGAARATPARAHRAGAIAAEDALHLLRAKKPRRVAVIGSDVIGVKLCEALAAAGHRVTLFEQTFAPEMALPRRWRALDALQRAQVARVPFAHIHALEPGAVLTRDAERTNTLKVDDMIWSRDLNTQPKLARALQAQNIARETIHQIGDGASVQYLARALEHAYKLAEKLA